MSVDKSILGCLLLDFRFLGPVQFGSHKKRSNQNAINQTQAHHQLGQTANNSNGHHHHTHHGPNEAAQAAAALAQNALINNFIPPSNLTAFNSGATNGLPPGLHQQLNTATARDLAYAAAVPCHLQNMATAPYLAAAAAAANSRHNQMPLGIYPAAAAYQDPSILSSQTAAAAAAMLTLPSTLPFHSLIPVTLPMIDHTRHLMLSVSYRF